jgi:subtilase family serine protease
VHEGSIVDVAVVEASNQEIYELGSLTLEITDEIPDRAEFALPKVLLNPNEWIDVQVILNNAYEIDLTTRIVGQTRDIAYRDDAVLRGPLTLRSLIRQLRDDEGRGAVGLL